MHLRITLAMLISKGVVQTQLLSKQYAFEDDIEKMKRSPGVSMNKNVDHLIH